MFARNLAMMGAEQNSFFVPMQSDDGVGGPSRKRWVEVFLAMLEKNAFATKAKGSKNAADFRRGSLPAKI
jgi:hypothetical protein